jgi:hypothetical protein
MRFKIGIFAAQKLIQKRKPSGIPEPWNAYFYYISIATMQTTHTGQTTQTEQPLQPLQTPYSIRADYVAIALIFFCLGFFIAYRTAVSIASNINFISNHPKG